MDRFSPLSHETAEELGMLCATAVLGPGCNFPGSDADPWVASRLASGV